MVPELLSISFSSELKLSDENNKYNSVYFFQSPFHRSTEIYGDKHTEKWKLSISFSSELIKINGSEATSEILSISFSSELSWDVVM